MFFYGTGTVYKYCKDALAITLPRRRHHGCVSVDFVSLKCSLLGDDRRITPMQAVKNERLCLQQRRIFFKELPGIAIPVVPETNSESTSWFPQGQAGSTCRIDTFLDTDQKQPFSKDKEVQRIQNGKRSDKEWKMSELIKRNRAANLITRSIHANLTLHAEVCVHRDGCKLSYLYFAHICTMFTIVDLFMF